MSPEEESISYLVDNNYEKKECIKCGRIFWTLEEGRETCGEPPCDPYSFIGNTPTSRQYSLEEMREEFLSFFEVEKHARVKRYPIVARWREDVYLVNASIYDFQPHVTSGRVPPPANPLVISQPCIRTVDIDNVGKTGRHLSVFEMGGAKAFNLPGKEIYWKSKTVELSVKFLAQLGIEEREITFKEKPWAGGGNGGSSLEVMVRGLEVATLVFMDMVEDPNGDTEIESIRYSPMDNRIVDTGYGIERLTWLSQGTDTVYESLYDNLINDLSKEVKVHRPDFLGEFIHLSSNEDGSEKKFIESLQEDERLNLDRLNLIYIIADHSRAITFLLYDGLVPSNSKAGYVLRMLIRRTLLARDRLGLSSDLWDIIEEQKERFKDILNLDLRESAFEIVKLEEIRFKELLTKGDDLIRKHSKGGEITSASVNTLFESNGLPIEYIKERCIALNIGFPGELQKNAGFYNVHKEPEKSQPPIKKKYPGTIKSYYENEKMTEFESRVLGKEGDYVILENTCFYPEGGGQPADWGAMERSGKIGKIDDVQIFKGVILHKTSGLDEVKEGDRIHGMVDRDRRDRLMKNHTATHILLSSIRDVLGPHVWQKGAQKDVKLSRLDVSHYSEPTTEDILRIEDRANEIIRLNLPLHKEFVDRNEAEKRYGFTLYQGGIPDGNDLRLVEIPGIDAEGCGGTHVDFTGEVGMLKIARVEKIQDGIIRFIFAAGRSALEYVNNQGAQLMDIKERLGDEPIKTFVSLENRIEVLKKAISEGFETDVISYKGKKVKMIKVREAIANEVSRGFASSCGVVLSEEKVRVASSYSDISAIELIKTFEKEGYVKGGGNSSFSQGKILKENLSLDELKGAMSDNGR